VRTLSSLDAGRKLWDVDNVEAHVRASLDAALEAKGARLNAKQYQRAFAFMWSLCWELSGLEDDGKTLRWMWEVQGFVAPRGPLEEFRPIKLRQLPSERSAELALEQIQRRHQTVFASVVKVRPRGSWDRRFGLAFATYSRRMIAKRVPDWYRTDPEFGDDRYGGNRLTREISYEGLAEQRHQDDGANDSSFLDRHSPGSRLEFVDELNRHAYQESLEEVLMRETASG
jgi:hypothetical protein